MKNTFNSKLRNGQMIALLLGSLSADWKQAFANPSDDAAKWASIVAQQTQYVIAKGDTLSDIAKKVFGSSHFWKKIWASNKDVIANPSRLKAGLTLTFPREMPSTVVTDLLSAPQENPSEGHSKARSTEWKLLPKQAWERYSTEFPDGVDSLGFDRRDKIINHPPIGFELQAIPLSERATILGEVFSSRTEAAYFSLHDLVFIKADETIKIGSTYALTKAPILLKSRDIDRTAYSYEILGKVKIIGSHAHIFIGRIVASRNFIPRGALLMALPARIPEMTPTPATTNVRGEVVMDHNFSTSVSAQFKEVFVDRGAADGVKVGNVFRAYKHYDPSAEDLLISHSDFIIDADLLVTRVTDNFCSAIVIRSTSPLQEGTTVSLIKDLSWLKNYEFDQYAEINNTPENLDGLDDADGLKPNEARELQQLETWKENPESSNASLNPLGNPLGGPLNPLTPQTLPEKLPDTAFGTGDAILGAPPPLPEAAADLSPDATGFAAPAPLPETVPGSSDFSLGAPGDSTAPPPLPESPLADSALPPPLPDAPLLDGGTPPPPLPDSVSADPAPLPDVLPPLPDPAVPMSTSSSELPPPPPSAELIPLDAGLPMPEPLAAATTPPSPPALPAAAQSVPPSDGSLMPPLDPSLDASMPIPQDLPPPLPE